MKKIIIFAFAVLAVSCNSNAQKKTESKTKDYKVTKTEAEWKEILTPEQYDVLRKAATEVPHSSELNDIDIPGTFVCAGCGNELYETKHKFESGTGWPSFDRGYRRWSGIWCRFKTGIPA
jgi:peptide-methionine (R)-S-oxide reductase